MNPFRLNLPYQIWSAFRGYDNPERSVPVESSAKCPACPAVFVGDSERVAAEDLVRHHNVMHEVGR